jgi:hypothetical protein
MEVLSLLYITGARVDSRIYQRRFPFALSHSQTRDIVFAFAEVDFRYFYQLGGF